MDYHDAARLQGDAECNRNWLPSGMGGTVRGPHEFRESPSRSVGNNVVYYCVHCLVIYRSEPR